MSKQPDSYASVLAKAIKDSNLTAPQFAEKIGCPPADLMDALRHRRSLGLEYADAIATALAGPEGRPDTQKLSLLRRLHAAESNVELRVSHLKGALREVTFLLASEREVLSEDFLGSIADRIRKEAARARLPVEEKKPSKADAPS